MYLTAAVLLVFAQLVDHSYQSLENDPAPPEGFTHVDHYDGTWSGVVLDYYVSPDNDLIVVSQGLSNVRAYLAIPVKRLFGFSTQPLDYTRGVEQRVDPRQLIFVAHSGGGSIVSWMAGVMGAPSVLFNSRPTRAALSNPGTQQMVYVVDGDWADPTNTNRRRFPGEYIVLDRAPGYGTHFIGDLIAAIELIQ